MELDVHGSGFALAHPVRASDRLRTLTAREGLTLSAPEGRRRAGIPTPQRCSWDPFAAGRLHDIEMPARRAQGVSAEASDQPGGGAGMTGYLRDIMTQNPVTVQSTDSVVAAARSMRDGNIGDVVVVERGRIQGILTDRDIVVRALAEGRDPASTTVGEICSRELTTLSPSDSIGDAVTMMREKAIRRLPVVDGGRPVGIVSLGDLAVARDPESALGGISAAPPNR
jgi:CBS domain-containing protein